MILYAKSLDASATVLSIIAGMMPLLVIFWIAASHHQPHRLPPVRAGGLEHARGFIFAMALVPLTERVLDVSNRLALLLVLLFGFNLSRGISSCAWLPWITALVPGELRGRYLAREAAVQNVASFVTFLVAAAVLAGHPQAWQFSLLFVFSAVTGAISLTFLNGCPMCPHPKNPARRGPGCRGWR